MKDCPEQGQQSNWNSPGCPMSSQLKSSYVGACARKSRVTTPPTVLENLQGWWRSPREKGSSTVQAGRREPDRKPVNWEQHADTAVKGFERNAFFVMVDGRQVCNLSDEVDALTAVEAVFIKLVPLVGG
jgi:hypothetical protein